MNDQGPFQNDALIFKNYNTANAANGAANIAKIGAGFLKQVTFSQRDAAPTAGDVVIYDSISLYGNGGSDTVLFRHTFTTTTFLPVTVVLDRPFVRGLSVMFTTVADVDVGVSFK